MAERGNGGAMLAELDERNRREEGMTPWTVDVFAGMR
jgi:hypothetical protein